MLKQDQRIYKTILLTPNYIITTENTESKEIWFKTALSQIEKMFLYNSPCAPWLINLLELG